MSVNDIHIYSFTYRLCRYIVRITVLQHLYNCTQLRELFNKNFEGRLYSSRSNANETLFYFSFLFTTENLLFFIDTKFFCHNQQHTSGWTSICNALKRPGYLH